MPFHVNITRGFFSTVPEQLLFPISIAFSLRTTFKRLFFHHRPVSCCNICNCTHLGVVNCTVNRLLFCQHTNDGWQWTLICLDFCSHQIDTGVFTRLVLSPKSGFGSTELQRINASYPHGQSDKAVEKCRKNPISFYTFFHVLFVDKIWLYVSHVRN